MGGAISIEMEIVPPREEFAEGLGKGLLCSFGAKGGLDVWDFWPHCVLRLVWGGCFMPYCDSSLGV